MKKNIFDDMTKLPLSDRYISNESLLEDTGADVSVIKKSVFDKLEIKKRRFSNKVVKRIVIAAAVAMLFVSMLSLPVVAENIYLIYGMTIGGYSYEAEFETVDDANIRVKDPNLNVDSLKVSGDRSGSAFIEITLSKKNGGSFIDTFKYLDISDLECRFAGETVNQSDPGMEIVIDTDINKYNGYGLAYTAKYQPEENGKKLNILIEIMVTSHDDDDNIIHGEILDGAKISIKSNKYIAASADEIITSYDNMKGENLNKYYKIQKEQSKNISYDIFTNSYSYTDIYYNGETFDHVKGRVKKVNLPFEIDFTYKCSREDEVIKFDEKQTISLMGENTTGGKMVISPFNVYIWAKKTTESYDEKKIDPLNSYVIMKDGTKYYLTGNGGDYTDKSIEKVLQYSLFDDSNDLANFRTEANIFIDKKEIEKIVISGTTVYTND